MKPRQLAQKMIDEMNRAAKKVWEEQGHLLDVDNKEEGRKFVWTHVRNHFQRL